MSPTSSASPRPCSSSRPSAIVAAELNRAQNLLLLTHQHPDGDGIGSMLALRMALLSLGKTTHCAIPDPCPARYEFLVGSESIATSAPQTEFDCAVALDCDGETRLGSLQDTFRSAPRTIDVDHHEAEQGFADVNWCDGSKAATALMVYDIIRDLPAPMTPDIATCLYTGIAADTGIFRFRNTSVEALALAAELVAAGADPFDIARRINDQSPPEKAKLLGRALSSLSIHHHGTVAIAVLRADDFRDTGALPEHTDGIIDELKRIENTQIVLLLREEAPSHWRASFRSLDADVAAICRRFGGGGHRVAAGCQLEGSAEQVTRRMAAEAGDALGASGTQ